MFFCCINSSLKNQSVNKFYPNAGILDQITITNLEIKYC